MNKNYETLKRFGVTCGLEPEWSYQHEFTWPDNTVSPRFTVKLPGVEVVANGCLTGEYGHGSTAAQAINNYLTTLEGKAVRAGGREALFRAANFRPKT